MPLSLLEIGTIVGIAIAIASVAIYKAHQSLSKGVFGNVILSSEEQTADVIRRVEDVKETAESIRKTQEELLESVNRMEDRLDDLSYAVYEIHRKDDDVDTEVLKTYTGFDDKPSELTEDEKQ